MKGHEHGSIGDAATGAAMVDIGGDAPDERFVLSFGDVVALSGDYFRPTGSAETAFEYWERAGSDDDPDGRLFSLARIPGAAGTRLDSRDEIIGALKVITVDEGFTDPRFAPGGEFAAFRFSPGANHSDVERRIRDRYLSLAATNDDHFVRPGRSGARTGSGFASAPEAYRHLHRAALDEAHRLGRDGGRLSHAMGREAAAQHYLTDAFAAGHLRTPVADIRRYWKARYPSFWDRLQRRVASDTATALRDLNRPLRLLPAGYLHRRTLSELRSRTSRYPELSLGDLVARAYHDWDNSHGLVLEGGGLVFGDGQVEEGVTRDLAMAAVRAGKDDVEVAFSLGRAGRALTGEALFAAVREATGADGEAFVAETWVPRLSAANPPQNWQAPDVETLFASPMVGTTGPTVHQALVAMLEPDGQFIRQLEGLGQGLAGDHGVFGLPVVGTRLSRRCCQAYHGGFVEPLSRDPEAVILDLVDARSRLGRDRGDPTVHQLAEYGQPHCA